VQGSETTCDWPVPKLEPGVISLTACLRAPGLEQSENGLDALLASAKFPSQ
jgi:hypothetical protein